MDKNKLQVMWQIGYAARLRLNPNDDLIHKNRGREPVNKIDHETIWLLYMKKYYGMNITFFCKKLLENEKIKVSEGLVRLIFKEHDEFSVQAWHRTKNELRKKLREMKKLTKQQKEVLVQLEAESYVRTILSSGLEKIEDVAKLFGKELGQLVADLHKSEKEKLFNFISERPFDITMNSPHFKELPLSKQESIKRTKQRFYDQTTAAGIMALFEDSYFLNMGKPIKNELDKYNLPTFESVMDKVIDFYYFGKKDE